MPPRRTLFGRITFGSSCKARFVFIEITRYHNFIHTFYLFFQDDIYVFFTLIKNFPGFHPHKRKDEYDFLA